MHRAKRAACAGPALQAAKVAKKTGFKDVKALNKTANKFMSFFKPKAGSASSPAGSPPPQQQSSQQQQGSQLTANQGGTGAEGVCR